MVVPECGSYYSVVQYFAKRYLVVLRISNGDPERFWDDPHWSSFEVCGGWARGGPLPLSLLGAARALCPGYERGSSLPLRRVLDCVQHHRSQTQERL